MVSRKPLPDSSSFWAQGGLAAAIGPDDSPQQHVEDTLAAGREACRRSAAELLAHEAPGVVAELERRGVEFDRDPDGKLALALEGGHSQRRVVHAGGAGTGRRITERLAALAAEDERVDVIEETSMVALWSDGERCHGVITDRGRIQARATILATGGAAALWARTTNPWGAIGAGSVMAHAAGGGLAPALAGRPSLPGLFAVGECACPGLHGATRLASNSLTECFVLGARAAAAAAADAGGDSAGGFVAAGDAGGPPPEPS